MDPNHNIIWYLYIYILGHVSISMYGTGPRRTYHHHTISLSLSLSLYVRVYMYIECPFGSTLENVSASEGYYMGLDETGLVFFTCLNDACDAGGGCAQHYTGFLCISQLYLISLSLSASLFLSFYIYIYIYYIYMARLYFLPGYFNNNNNNPNSHISQIWGRLLTLILYSFLMLTLRH